MVLAARGLAQLAGRAAGSLGGLHAKATGGWSRCTKALMAAPARAVPPLASLQSVGEGGLAIGAHRGCGENVLWHATDPLHMPPVYRENTIRSFAAALADGAQFLEFDVQVTADGVPVIWHDNYVVYGEHHNPVSKLVSELTLDQFRALAPINQAAEEPDEGLLGTSPTASDAGTESIYGTSPASSTASSRLLRQLQNGIPAQPFEPTLRAWDVTQDDHLPTLGEVFAELPPEVPFDIEIKLATPDSLVATPPEEISRMLDAILSEVDAAAAQHGPRLLFFSCFDPDICLELRRRRPAALVYFLTGGGEYAHADPRRNSLAAAIDLATIAGLQGIIVNAVAIGKHPWVVAQARAAGLSVMTYGVPNNDPAFVLEQQALGVAAVIVDDVARVVTDMRVKRMVTAAALPSLA